MGSRMTRFTRAARIMWITALGSGKSTPSRVRKEVVRTARCARPRTCARRSSWTTSRISARITKRRDFAGMAIRVSSCTTAATTSTGGSSTVSGRRRRRRRKRRWRDWKRWSASSARTARRHTRKTRMMGRTKRPRRARFAVRLGRTRKIPWLPSASTTSASTAR